MTKQQLLSKIAYFYIWFTKNSLRVKEIDLDGKLKEQSVYALWHGEQILPLCLNSDLDIAAMCSMSKDGEIQAGVLKKFGFIAVRGSSSHGAERALIESIRYARKGHSIAFTVDGPKGPIYKVKAGLLMVAQKAGIRLIPISAIAKHSIIFSRSWDKFKVPLPFSKTVAVYGHEIRIAKEDNLEEVALKVEQSLNKLSQFANKYYWSKDIKEVLSYHPKPKFLVISNDTEKIKSIETILKQKYKEFILDVFDNKNTIKSLKKVQYDVVINLENSIKSKIISKLIKPDFIIKSIDEI